MLANSLRMNCYQISPNERSNLDANKISFLAKPVQLPSGVSDKDVISIHSTLKNFESQIYQLRKEAESCSTATPINCLLIYNRLKVILKIIASNEGTI